MSYMTSILAEQTAHNHTSVIKYYIDITNEINTMRNEMLRTKNGIEIIRDEILQTKNEILHIKNEIIASKTENKILKVTSIELFNDDIDMYNNAIAKRFSVIERE